APLLPPPPPLQCAALLQVARPDLRRHLVIVLAAAAGHLRRRLRPRPLPDALSTTPELPGASALHARMERDGRRARPAGSGEPELGHGSARRGALDADMGRVFDGRAPRSRRCSGRLGAGPTADRLADVRRPATPLRRALSLVGPGSLGRRAAPRFGRLDAAALMA